ncbi:MAG: DUF6491 family protein [Steroidobacteraceae bacterium]
MQRTLIPVLAAAAALSACATNAPRTAQVPLPGKDACLYVNTVSSWEVLDEQNLIVHAPMQKDTYLVKLFQPATGLRFQEVLGFEDGDHNNQLCSSGDQLRIGGPVEQRVGILAVRQVTADDVSAYKAALAAAAKPQG